MTKRKTTVSKARQNAIIAAVREAGKYERNGWAHPDLIANDLGVSRSTAVRWCQGQCPYVLEWSIVTAWRRSKAVKSIRFRVVADYA